MPDAWQGQGEATAIVWHQGLGETATPPPVVWSSATCPSGIEAGQHPVVVYSDGRCSHGGEYDAAQGIAYVAIENGIAISSTTFSHEMIHAHLVHLGLPLDAPGDPQHTLTAWWDRVPELDADLRAAGL